MISTSLPTLERNNAPQIILLPPFAILRLEVRLPPSNRELHKPRHDDGLVPPFVAPEHRGRVHRVVPPAAKLLALPDRLFSEAVEELALAGGDAGRGEDAGPQVYVREDFEGRGEEAEGGVGGAGVVAEVDEEGVGRREWGGGEEAEGSGEGGEELDWGGGGIGV